MKRYLCVAGVLLASLVILVLAQQTKFVPKGIPDGETVYYVPGQTIYHEIDCPEIAGKNAFAASAGTLIRRNFEPCTKCLCNEVPVTAKTETAAETSGTSSGRTVAKWEGAAQKNTETFTVNTNEWVIHWQTTGDSNFIIWVYNADTNESVEMVANIVGNGRDSSVIRGKGRYYLKINSSQPYKIEITEK